MSSKSKGRKGKPVFKNLVFAICGNFINTQEQPLPHSQLATYITYHAGTFAEDVSNETTHLICTMEEFTRKPVNIKVTKALRLKNCKIVNYDWILDCLSMHATPRKSREGPFLLKNMLKRERAAQKVKKEAKERTENGGVLVNELVNATRTGQFHIYVDPTGFKYEVPITNVTFLNDENNSVYTRKYTLYIFETNALPCLYKWGARYNEGKRKPCFYREGCIMQMHFDKAFAGFRKFFREKTGVNWDERLDNVIVEDETKFRYLPPEDGNPRGMLPPKFIMPKKVDEEEDEETEESSEEETEEESDSGESTMIKDEEPVEKHRQKTPSPSPLEHPYQFAVQGA